MQKPASTIAVPDLMMKYYELPIILHVNNANLTFNKTLNVLVT